ncbi:glycosyltransferase family 4 protein [Rufibacter latericius]|uniref:Glycosyltransferase family 4 protein n=1 Tax=Rufibacter latericius TaxID=2487040 RepID=A0A3M9MBC8_9BACT|nr:glycosyltransferase family 4 protein [Rufibacter latericius]RNI22457.1 glycosyltransferase family 4 protein [Rufibacter latericius]
MKVAIVHEWFVDYSGSERVVEQLLEIFPEASLFSVIDFMPEHLRKHIFHKTPITTFIQKLPFARKHYRNYLFLMPLAIEQLDVSGFDVVISSSHAVAKGVLTHSNQLHICYCHSPARYAWDLYHQYLRENNLTSGVKGFIARLILHRFRAWDVMTVNRVDYFIANSRYIARRIRKNYGRDSSVIYPPVDLEGFTLSSPKENFYLTASRLVSYKRIDLIVEAFNEMPDKQLVVIGEGPDEQKLKAIAGPNIKLMGYQPFEVLKDHLQRAKAFVFAAEEDFGITPVEAQACGTPVIAFGKGGALETVTPETGVFFYSQEKESLKEAVAVFESHSGGYNSQLIRSSAQKFNQERFKVEMRQFVLEKYNDLQQNK